jgi:F-type H+-transporting ATPase subunit a
VAITAGHIVILSFIALVFIFESYSIGVLSTIMVTFINVIELLVATIQAYVFTLFSAMYIGSAVAEHEHDDHH